MAEVTEVVTKFAFEGSTAPLGEYNKQLTGAIKGLGAFATATFGALSGLTMWADSILKSIDPMVQMSRQTGISIEKIQELGFASMVNGGSIDGMSASLEGLTERIGEAVALGTGEGVEIFKKLGIDLKDASGRAKTADKIFGELRETIVSMELDQTQVLSIARRLGMTTESVQLLTKTNEEMAVLRERSREVGQVSTETATAAANYNDELSIATLAFKNLKVEIAGGFAPQMTKLTKGFKDLIVVNKEWLSEGISDGITVLIGFGKAIWNVGSIIVDVIGFFLQFKPVLAGVTTAVGVLMASFFPITSIVALVVGLILVFDDLFTAFAGGKSVIGDFFKAFGVDLKFVGDYLTWVWDVLKAIFSLDFGALGKLGETAFKKVVGVFSQSEQTGGVGSSSIDNRSVNQDIKIDIKTADPQEAGRAVSDSMQKQMNDASAQTGHGGL